VSADLPPALSADSASTDDVEVYLRQATSVLAVHRGHDSGNTSAVVAAGGQRWFVKWSADPAAVPHLESAIRFHAIVRHPAIAALRHVIRTPSGLALVHDWVPGEILNDALAPGSLPRQHPASAFARFRRLSVTEIAAALEVVLDAHLEVARHGFVAVDFYDGCLIYDFARRTMRLCDLDSYAPGPYVLNLDRQFGSTRFMPPEEFRRGATIDERSTVYTLGRTAFVLLSGGPLGEQAAGRWRAGPAALRVAQRATADRPEGRYQTVAGLTAAWREAVTADCATMTAWI
jgi:serine/threonine-protein kinase